MTGGDSTVGADHGGGAAGEGDVMIDVLSILLEAVDGPQPIHTKPTTSGHGASQGDSILTGMKVSRYRPILGSSLENAPGHWDDGGTAVASQ